MNTVTPGTGPVPERTPLRCRFGLHRWVLWPEPLRRETGEAPWVCARCGAEPRVP